jgi:hypothetical protein
MTPERSNPGMVPRSRHWPSGARTR